MAQPNEDEQGWVLDSLHDLIEQKGIQPFVSAHLLTPTEEFFPDTWTPDKEGVQQVLSRMMVYAGLQDLQVSLVLSGQPNQELNSLLVTPYEKNPAGWFAGIRHNCCFFGMDVEHIHEPEEVVAVFGHEVAHAYRHYHKLEVEDIEEEERLTDLTCVYLGFGIFNTNSSFRYRSGGLNGLSTEGHQWSIQSKGYLSPELFSFALAVQWIVRDLPNMERTQLLRHLETNQRSYVRKTLKRLKGQRASLCHRLNIPPREDWPSTPPLEDLLKEDITFDTFWSTEKNPKHYSFRLLRSNN